MIRKMRILFLTILIFLTFCKNKNENIDPETKKKNEIIKKIKERTERDLNKIGIKKILLVNNGRWSLHFISGIKFSEDGTGYTILNGKKDDKFFYWKVENNKFYINPNNAINPLNENKFFLITVKPIEIPNYIETKIIERCKYSIELESEDRRFKLSHIISIFPKKIVD